MIKSEFDPYSNMTYITLDKDGNKYCLEEGCYLKQRKMSDTIDDLAEDASDQQIETHNNQLDFIISKLELAIIPYKDN